MHHKLIRLLLWLPWLLLLMVIVLALISGCTEVPSQKCTKQVQDPIADSVLGVWLASLDSNQTAIGTRLVQDVYADVWDTADVLVIHYCPRNGTIEFERYPRAK